MLVLVQKKDENLLDAMSFLLKAKETKQSKKVILIQTQENTFMDETIYNIDDFIIVRSPSLRISQGLQDDVTL